MSLSFNASSTRLQFQGDETADKLWTKAGNPFSDSMFSPSTQDIEKVKALKKALAATRGCIDPEAKNYNPDATEDDGSCVYVSVEKAAEADLGTYVGSAVTNLFAPMKDLSPNMPAYKVQPYEGRTATQSEIKKLMQFQDIVNRTLDAAEKSQKNFRTGEKCWAVGEGEHNIPGSWDAIVKILEGSE